MNRTLRIVIAGAVVATAAGALILAGAGAWTAAAQGVGPFGRGFGGMMGGYAGNLPAGRGFGGMMGNYGNNPAKGFGFGGMMGGAGMMGGWATAPGVKPLTVEQTTAAVNAYLSGLNNPDLSLAEVMVFDNNSYARIVEKSTGRSAFELLVNPATQAVTPEPGPNMMWNVKYSPMSAMMGIFSSAATGDVTVSAAEALKTAQAYLDQYQPGVKTAVDANAFYGYYTIDTLRDGKVIGMLSVNGYTGQVFPHTWHGTFITMSEGR